MKKLGFFVLLITGFYSCKNENSKKDAPGQPVVEVNRPAFNADSAYLYVQKQVDFGPRVPGTPAHKEASVWLTDKLGEFVDSSFIQETTATMYNGNEIPVYNIIGQINPQAEDRILLGAHWDSRHIADKDSDIERQQEFIDGANDGASGVGVLIEIARQLQLKNTNLGIDIIFFDAEDLGEPEGERIPTEDPLGSWWCLGSQYWSKNPHVKNYTARYGILLDMVGATDAIFKFESFAYRSLGGAKIYTKVWNNAHQLGYSNLFRKQPGGYITDDHVFVIRNRQIPMIDIIDYSDEKGGFGHFHHTHSDNMDIIDKHTLKAVGETVLFTILEN